MKRCPDCGEIKPRDEFHKNRARLDGLGSICKPCHNDRCRQRRERNPEPARGYGRKWREANREAYRLSVRESARRRRQANPELHRAYTNQRRNALRAEVIGMLGRCCAICGTTEGLQIDHINGDGGEHRARAGRYRILLDVLASIQAGEHRYQPLCGPCNKRKSNSAQLEKVS